MNYLAARVKLTGKIVTGVGDISLDTAKDPKSSRG